MRKKLIILFLIFLAGNIDYLGIWSNKTSVQAALGLMVLTLTFCLFRFQKTCAGVACYVISLILILALKSHIVIALPLLTSIPFILEILKNRKYNKFIIAGITILTWSAFMKYCIQYIPVIWNGINYLSYKITKILTMGTELGSSLSGIMPLLTSAASIIIIGTFEKSKTKLVRYLVYSAAVYCFSLNIISLLLIKMPQIGLNCLWLYFALQSIILILMITNSNTLYKNYIMVLSKKAIVLPLILCIMFISIGLYPPSKLPEKKPHVTVVNKGIMVDMTQGIQPGEPYGYGESQSVYGLIPLYIKSFGFETAVVKSFSDIAWDMTDIIVLVNYNDKNSSGFTEELEKFVEKGGGLCIVADHTDVDGHASVINTITKWSGLRLNDDLAEALSAKEGKSWNHSLESNHHLLTQDIKSQTEVQINAGASLKISGFNSFPMVVGKFGFSDTPNPQNTGEGGRVGNRSFERFEKAGDTILVASACYGKGKVVFFADSSPFQTPNLGKSSMVLSRTFWWLSAKDYISISLLALFRILSAILCFAVLLYCLLRKDPCSFAVLALPVSFIIGIALCASVNSISLNTFTKGVYQKADIKNIAMIDTSLGERFDMSSLSDNNIDGLLYNLMRAKIPAMVSPDFKTGLNSKMLFIAAPSKAINKNEAKQLEEYVYNGGTLILSAGNECSSQIYNLLNLFEVSIKPVLLGPVPWEDSENPQTLSENSPKFKEAWPIHILNTAATKPYYTFNEYNMVTVTKKGKGKFILIGDSKFLYSSNLEQESGAKIENVKFMQNLLKDVESYD